jgi:hypothetical protein
MDLHGWSGMAEAAAPRRSAELQPEREFDLILT